MTNPRPERPTYIVIPCGADKVDHAAPARELYVGGMFKIALAAAEAEAPFSNARILILSALHGLVELDTVLDPYNVKMGDPGSITVERVAEQAIALGMDDERADVYGFLPKAYFQILDEACRTFYTYPAPVYEACGGIGEQKGVCRIVRDTDDLMVNDEAA